VFEYAVLAGDASGYVHIIDLPKQSITVGVSKDYVRAPKLIIRV
jgi:hypothetical protein